MAALPDPDGVYRRVFAYVTLDGHFFPAYGVAIAAAFLHVKPVQIAIHPGKAVVFHAAKFPEGPERMLSIPIDDQGNLLIDYAGRWTDGPFPYFSFVDVWDAIEEGDLDALRAQVSGKIVLILHAAIEADKRRTPLELKAPGGFIHANILNTILTNEALYEVSGTSRFMLIRLFQQATTGSVAAWLDCMPKHNI